MHVTSPEGQNRHFGRFEGVGALRGNTGGCGWPAVSLPHPRGLGAGWAETGEKMQAQCAPGVGRAEGPRGRAWSAGCHLCPHPRALGTFEMLCTPSPRQAPPPSLGPPPPLCSRHHTRPRPPTRRPAFRLPEKVSRGR